MINLAFVLGVVFHSVAVTLLYSAFKQSSKYYLVGLLIGLITNSLWLYIAKNSNDSNLYVRALIWDCVIVGAYTLLPPLFFGVKLTSMVSFGCVLIVIGIIITKVGG